MLPWWGRGGARDILPGVVGPVIAFIISLGFRHPFTQMPIRSSGPHVVMFLSVSCGPCTVLYARDTVFGDLHSVGEGGQ